MNSHDTGTTGWYVAKQVRSQCPGLWHERGNNAAQGDHWTVVETPAWYECAEYRVKVTYPSIDWSQVHSDVIAVTRQKNNDVRYYTSAPTMNNGEWFYNRKDISIYVPKILVPTHYNPGTCDWQESLIVRPEESKVIKDPLLDGVQHLDMPEGGA